MRRMAEDMGLEIPSVGVWSLWENNLVSDSPAIREKAFGIVEKQIEAAHLLGADTILVVRDGKIIEQGTHEGLLKKQGYYYTLYRNQFEQELSQKTLA